MARTGRRPGPTTTREDVLDAARAAFAAHGFGGATIRGIARDAGVDPSLVHHHFGTKEELFAATLELPYDPLDLARRLADEGLDDFGERAVRAIVPLWDEHRDVSPMLAAVRSTAEGDAAGAVREFLASELLGGISRVLPGPDPKLRAALVGSQLVGLIMVRYALCIEPIASADVDTLATVYGPTIQRYVTGDLQV